MAILDGLSLNRPPAHPRQSARPRPAPDPRESDFTVGLDLGQSHDPTAMVTIRRTGTGVMKAGGELYRYDCVDLQRLPIGTAYPEVRRIVAEHVMRPELRPLVNLRASYTNGHRLQPMDHARPPRLIIDATGVGRAVTDLFLDSTLPCPFLPVTITGGNQARFGTWNETKHEAAWVPKADLVAAVRVLLDSRRLGIPASLPLADLLRKELMGFRLRLTKAGGETYGNDVREAPHDDLVLGLALALWASEVPRKVRGMWWSPSPTAGWRG